MNTRRFLRRSVAVATVAMSAVLAGCSSPPETHPTPSVSSTAVEIPAGGATLRQRGFEHGPADQFSIPEESVLVTRIDQTNVVTAVFSEPSGAELHRYLTQNLPPAGFTVTAQADDAIVFDGHGWNGSFIVGATSAVTLRRQ